MHIALITTQLCLRHESSNLNERHGLDEVVELCSSFRTRYKKNAGFIVLERAQFTQTFLKFVFGALELIFFSKVEEYLHTLRILYP